MYTASTFLLTLLGKVSGKVVRKLIKSKFIKAKNHEWFFVDYFSAEIKKKSSFDVILQGEEKTLIPEFTSIKLLEIFDQFGNKLLTIPKGFQTICYLEFENEIPKDIDDLPLLLDWEYNPNSISIAQHEYVQLHPKDILMKDMYRILSTQLINIFISHSFNNISEHQFIENLITTFKTEKTSAKKMLIDLISLGYITQKENKSLELVDLG